MVIEDWAVVTVLIGVILTFISTLITGVFSIKIFLLKKKENEKRDKGQFKRDDAHIAIKMYEKISDGKKETVKDEVNLYERILGEVREARNKREK